MFFPIKIRNLSAIAILASGTVYYATKVVINAIVSRNGEKYLKNAVAWSKFILKTFKINLKVRGLENLNPNETYIFASNHSSYFDIPILFYALKQFRFAIIYKKELEKIPAMGQALKVSPFIPVERFSLRGALESVEKTLSLMKENDSPIIFPEGTRSKDGKLGKFKRGAFLIASRSKKPIVPIAIKGASDILPRGSFDVKMNSEAEVVIGKPIEKTPKNKKEELEIMELTRSAIDSQLK